MLHRYVNAGHGTSCLTFVLRHVTSVRTL